MVVPARIGRAGVQTYTRPDGTTVRAYRPAEEVFAADFTGAPVTVGHPDGGVSPRTWRQYAIGSVARQSATPVVADGQQWAEADLQVADADGLAGVQAGELCECSCAYDCTREWTPGVTADGQPYDVVFRQLVPNHVALGPKGFARAGRSARVLISDGEDMTHVFSDTGFIADSGTPAVPAAPAAPAAPVAEVDPLVRLVNDSAAEVSRLRAENEKLTAKLAAADAKVNQLTADAAKLPQQIADGVTAELAFRARVAPHLAKDFVVDGKMRREIVVAALKTLDPKFAVTDAMTDGYLDTYLEAASKYAGAAPHDHNKDVKDGTAPTAPTIDPAKHIADSTKDLWKGTK